MRKLVAAVLLVALAGVLTVGQSQQGGTSSGNVGAKVEVTPPWNPLPIPLPPIPPIDINAAQYRGGVWLLPVADFQAMLQGSTGKETLIGVLLIPPERTVFLGGRSLSGGPFLVTFQRHGAEGTLRLRDLRGGELLSSSGQIPSGKQAALRLGGPGGGPSLQKVRVKLCVEWGDWKVCLAIEFGKDEKK